MLPAPESSPFALGPPPPQPPPHHRILSRSRHRPHRLPQAHRQDAAGGQSRRCCRLQGALSKCSVMLQVAWCCSTHGAGEGGLDVDLRQPHLQGVLCEVNTWHACRLWDPADVLVCGESAAEWPLDDFITSRRLQGVLRMPDSAATCLR